MQTKPPEFSELSGALVVLGVTATSSMPLRDNFSIQSHDPGRELDMSRAESIIEGIATKHRLKRCAECTEATFTGKRGIVLKYSRLSANRGVRVSLEGAPYSVLGFGPGAQPDLREITSELYRDLGAAFPDLEVALSLSAVSLKPGEQAQPLRKCSNLVSACLASCDPTGASVGANPAMCGQICTPAVDNQPMICTPDSACQARQESLRASSYAACTAQCNSRAVNCSL